MAAAALCRHGQTAGDCPCPEHVQMRHCQQCGVAWNRRKLGPVCWCCESGGAARNGGIPSPAPPRREERAG